MRYKDSNKKYMEGLKMKEKIKKEIRSIIRRFSKEEKQKIYLASRSGFYPMGLADKMAMSENKEIRNYISSQNTEEGRKDFMALVSNVVYEMESNGEI